MSSKAAKAKVASRGGQGFCTKCYKSKDSRDFTREGRDGVVQVWRMCNPCYFKSPGGRQVLAMIEERRQSQGQGQAAASAAPAAPAAALAAHQCAHCQLAFDSAERLGMHCFLDHA